MRRGLLLLGAVLLLLALAGVVLFTHPEIIGLALPAHHDAGPAAEAGSQTPGGAMPTTPAGAELLSRIRSCSARELDGVADRLSAGEALALYRQLSSADRQAVLSALPQPLLARKAEQLLGIPPVCFQVEGDAGRLAASLVEAAMGRPGAGPPRHALSFSIQVDGDNAPIRPQIIFRPEDRKIHACLDAGPEALGESGVLVRWVVDSSDDPVHLRYQPLAADHRWNYVSFERKDAWPAGTYRVGFYRVRTPAELLAEGTYVIGSD